MAVITGIEKLAATQAEMLRGKRVAVLANQCSVTPNFEHLADILRAAPGVELVRLFAPEHGFGGTWQDMETVTDEANVVDATSGHTTLPIVSLYGESVTDLYPKKELLEDIEVLVVDLPDIGARYYTFAQTMAYCMQVCAQTNTTVLVLDRPNPINGNTVEGSTLLDSCKSFCGYGAIAQRHGMTLAELALLYNQGTSIAGQQIAPINCILEVLPCEGWTREQYFDHTGLPWVIPSVNMPTLDTAIVYPGMCLFEATALSEGRGTTRPFEFVGAPFINGRHWLGEVAHQGLSLSGATLRAIEFIPKFQKHKDTRCGGVQIHVHDRSTFQPLRWALALIAAAKKLYPQQFSWRSGSYEFIDSVPAIDLLYGSDSFRQLVETGKSLSPLEEEISEFSAVFSEARKEFLLY